MRIGGEVAAPEEKNRARKQIGFIKRSRGLLTKSLKPTTLACWPSFLNIPSLSQISDMILQYHTSRTLAHTMSATKIDLESSSADNSTAAGDGERHPPATTGLHRLSREVYAEDLGLRGQ